MKMKNKVFLFVFILVMVPFLFGCGSTGLSKTYDKAQNCLAEGKYEEAAELFDSISTYEDSSRLALYSKALLYGEQENYKKALETLDFLGDYKDSSQLIKYYKICELSESSAVEDVLSASKQFEAISAYRDCADRAEKCRQIVYHEATSQFNKGKYSSAGQLFSELGAYKDSKEQLEACKKAEMEREKAEAYLRAEALLLEKDFDGAIKEFASLGDYKDSKERIEEVKEAKKENTYSNAVQLFNNKKYDEAKTVFEGLGNYKNSQEQVKLCKYKLAETAAEEGRFDEAIFTFEQLGDFLDSKEKILQTQQTAYGGHLKQAYQAAEKNLLDAKEFLDLIPESYSDADDLRETVEKYSPYSGKFHLDIYGKEYVIESTFRLLSSNKVVWKALTADGEAVPFIYPFTLGIERETEVEDLSVSIHWNAYGEECSTNVDFLSVTGCSMKISMRDPYNIRGEYRDFYATKN